MGRHEQFKLQIEFAHADPPALFFQLGRVRRLTRLGAKGDWRVQAPGVGAVHMFLRFDGRVLHVKAVGPVWLDNERLCAEWVVVPPMSTLKIGPVVWGRFAPIDETHDVAPRPFAQRGRAPSAHKRTSERGPLCTRTGIAKLAEDPGLETEDTELSSPAASLISRAHSEAA